MRSYVVVPLLEVFFGGECVSVSFVGVEEFFGFPIALGVLDSAKDVLDALGIQEGFELAFTAFAGVVLCSVVGDALFDGSVGECFLHAFNGSLAGGALAFNEAKDGSAGIVYYEMDPGAISTLVPVEMYSS